MKRIEKRLADLKAAQENGSLICPRCGQKTMKPKLYANALSRLADIQICDSCGLDEAKAAYMGAPGTIYQWAMLQPVRPEGDFKAITAKEAWDRVCAEQANAITGLYHRWEDGESPEEIRFEAFESCPGLTQIWTEPYQMKYRTSDGALMVTFKKTDTGLEMAASLVDEK